MKGLKVFREDWNILINFAEPDATSEWFLINIETYERSFFHIQFIHELFPTEAS